jgi:hypothetical protein
MSVGKESSIQEIRKIAKKEMLKKVTIDFK